MKSLWEQYGLVIIAIIAAVALIVLTLSMSDKTTDGIESNVNKFEQVGADSIDDLIDEDTTATE